MRKITDSLKGRRGFYVLLALVVLIAGIVAFGWIKIQPLLTSTRGGIVTLDTESISLVESSPIAVVTPTPVVSDSPEVKSDVVTSAPAPLKSVSQKPAAPKQNVKRPSISAPASILSNAFLDLVNSVRRSSGLSPVKYNAILNTAAAAKCNDMKTQNYLSHTNPQGKSDFDFATDVGYRYQKIGSNIAKGHNSDQAVFDGWLASTGHRENILASWGTELGFAGCGGYYSMFIAKPR